MQILICIVAISAIIVLTIDIYLRYVVFQKQHLELYDANEYSRALFCENLSISARNASLQQQYDDQSKLLHAKEEELKTVRKANLLLSLDLDQSHKDLASAGEREQKLKLALSDSENKLKKTEEHINILRVEINRQQARRNK